MSLSGAGGVLGRAVLLVTETDERPDVILPALGLLGERINVSAITASTGRALNRARIVLVDGRIDLVAARRVCQRLRTDDVNHVILAIVTEGGVAAVSRSWQLDDVLIATASPAEVEMRIRLAQHHLATNDDAGKASVIQHGSLRIDPLTRLATVGGHEMPLTYLEFELLTHLAQHPGRVFSRGELLACLWGREYGGGHRTVDVHVRRLRMALGKEHADHIGTVRRVGYTFRAEPWPMPQSLAAWRRAGSPTEGERPAEHHMNTGPARCAPARGRN